VKLTKRMIRSGRPSETRASTSSGRFQINGCRRIAVVIGALAALFMFEPSSAGATPIVIDQQNLASSGGIGNEFVAQTFTVGVAGGLVGVDISPNGGPPWSGDLFITGTTAGVPNASDVLVTEAENFTIGPLGSPTYVFPSVPVSVGEVLALVVEGGASFTFSAGNAYPGGELFAGTSIPLLIAFPDDDLTFRTYVDTGAPAPAVPEPASLLLVGTGVFGARQWRKRRGG
jgi:hypothetical protein